MENNILQFIADSVKVMGPKVDGGYSVTFQVGGYMWDKIKELPNLNGKTIAVGVLIEPKEKTEQEDTVEDDIPKLEE